MIRPSVSFCLTWLLAAAVAGCGLLTVETKRPLARVAPQTVLETFEKAPTLNLSVYPAAMELPVGATQALTVTVKDDAGKFVNVPVSVTSRNAGVAGVADRNVTGAAEGATEVVVTAGGMSVVVPVRVIKQPLPSLPPKPPKPPTMPPPTAMGATAVTAESFGVLPQALAVNAPAGSTIAWSSRDPLVATVDANGVVTARSGGTATIVATDQDGQAAEFQVTVRQRPYFVQATGPNGETTLALEPGSRTTARGTARDPNGFDVPVTGFVSDVGGVAQVTAAGELSAVAAGQTIVRAVAAGIAGPDRTSLAVGVGQPAATATTGLRVASLPDAMTLPVGQTELVTVVARAADGSPATPEVTYTAGPGGVVSVSPQGLVTALQPGTTTVTASGPGFTRTVAVTVSPLTPSPFEILGPDRLSAPVLGPLPQPLRATDPAATWESSNPAVATVGPDGRVQLVGPGTATITARAGGLTDTITITVAPEAAFVAAHSDLPGDPRQVLVQAPDFTMGLRGSAYDAGGTAVPVTGLVTDDPRVAVVRDGRLVIVGPGSTYVRAVADGVASDNTNSIWVSYLPGGTPATSGGGGAPAPAPSSSPRFGVQPAPGATPTPRIQADYVDVQPASLTLTAGQSAPIGAIVHNRDWSVQPTTPNFSSGNPAVATVDATGKVTAVGPGATTITVSVANDTASVPVTVTAGPAAPTDLAVNVTALRATSLGPVPVRLTTTGGAGPVTFTSLSPGVVTVDASGNLRAVADGPIVAPAVTPGPVIVRVSDGTTTIDVAVTVEQLASWVYVTVDPAVLSGNPREVYVATLGQQLQLFASALDYNGNAVPLDTSGGNGGWLSTTPGVVSVDATGKITALAIGTARVRVTAKRGVVSDDQQSINFVVGDSNSAIVDTSILLP